MNEIVDVSDDSSLSVNDFKPNFDQLTPEEMCYCSESFLRDFEEANRRNVFGLPLPQSVVGIRKWVQENLHPQLQFNDKEPIFYQGILVIRKVQ